jgi:DNA-binding phage protein
MAHAIGTRRSDSRVGAPHARVAYGRGRAEIRAIGVNAVARETAVSRSRVQAFLNEGTTPQVTTHAKLKKAVSILRADSG